MLKINEANFPDKKFREYIVDEFDLDRKSFLTNQEIKDIINIDIGYEYNIKSLQGIELFPNLQELICCRTAITELDVSKNYNLVCLDCNSTRNNSLDVSNNLKLDWLDCSYTGITSLDVSKNPELTYLDCGNTGITELDVSNRSKLERLNCENTPIINLDKKGK